MAIDKGELLSGAARRALAIPLAGAALAAAGCGGAPYTVVNAGSIDNVPGELVAPYSDTDTYNFVGQTKSNIHYRRNGSRTYTIDTGNGLQRVKERCDANGTLLTVLPYKGRFKLVMGTLFGFEPCDDEVLEPSEFPNQT